MSWMLGPQLPKIKDCPYIMTNTIPQLRTNYQWPNSQGNSGSNTKYNGGNGGFNCTNNGGNNPMTFQPRQNYPLNLEPNLILIANNFNPNQPNGGSETNKNLQIPPCPTKPKAKCQCQP